MHKKQISKVAELSNSKITSHDCLHSLQSTYANTNMCSLNHTNIIGPITYAECDLSCTFLNQAGYLQNSMQNSNPKIASQI